MVKNVVVRRNGNWKGTSNLGESSDNKKNSKKNNSKQSKSNKTLKHHGYYGSAKSTTDCVTVTKCILNHMRRTYKNGSDVADALEAQKDVDFHKDKPAIRTVSTKDAQGKDTAEETRESQLEQAKMEFCISLKRLTIRSIILTAFESILISIICFGTWELAFPKTHCVPPEILLTYRTNA